MATRTNITDIEAGDEFKVVRGSKAGSFGVTGTVRVEELDAPSARIAVSVGKFGFRFNVQLELTRDGDEVDIVASGSAFETITVRGLIVEETSVEVRIVDVAGELEDTHLVIAEDATATLTAEIPSLGSLQLLLEPA